MPWLSSAVPNCNRCATISKPTAAQISRTHRLCLSPMSAGFCSSRMAYTERQLGRDNSTSCRSQAKSEELDTAAYDAERLRLDAAARNAMISQAQEVTAREQSLPGSTAGAWKWEIRKKMWDYMEENDIARFPRPVHHRIPNFVNADQAALRLAQLPEFIAAKTVKVNPDTPQKMVRWHVLSAGKHLLSPQPRLRTGFFSSMTKASFPADALMEACTSAGVAKYGRPLSLDDPVKVDLIIVGSSAVDRNGARLGKGEGFAELEYGMLRWMGAVDDSTLVITTVHDCQVLDTPIDSSKMLEHDVPVDVIVTPTQVIRTTPSMRKPPGILWHKLSPEKLAQIRVLQELKARIEKETGEKLPTGPSEKLPPLAQRGARRQDSSGVRRGRGGGSNGAGRGRGRGSAASGQREGPRDMGAGEGWRDNRANSRQGRAQHRDQQQ